MVYGISRVEIFQEMIYRMKSQNHRNQFVRRNKIRFEEKEKSIVTIITMDEFCVNGIPRNGIPRNGAFSVMDFHEIGFHKHFSHTYSNQPMIPTSVNQRLWHPSNAN